MTAKAAIDVERTLAQPSSTADNFVPSVQPLMDASAEGDSTITAKTDAKKGDDVPIIQAREVVFVLKGKQYKAVKSISESSGEAQVLLVEREGKQYCLKVYYPNFRFKEDILNAVWNINFEMVVKLYDYGRTTVNGIERDYELMEYLDGGTLSQYKLDGDFRKFRLISLQAAAALAACHSYGIIHKDIKPGNYFFRDKEQTEVVLGDFGISTMLKDGDELIRTSQARTPAFAAPEMYDDVIDGEVEIDNRVDFYSLGITLLYLWLGKSPFAKNERLMMRLKQEGRLPHLDEVPERVSMLVRGLTSINPQRRWGYDEVERWFKGEDVPIDTSSVYLRYKTFMVDPERNIVAHDLKELVPLLYENQSLAVHYLYGNRLVTWLDECGNNKVAVVLNDIVEHKYPTNQQAGLMAALYAMEPNFPYYDINDQPCNTIQEVAITLIKNAKEYRYKLQDPNDTLFVYLDAHLSCNLERLRSYFVNADDKSVLKLVYEIDKSLPFLTTIQANSIAEIVSAFATGNRTEDEWVSLTDGRLLAWLYGKADISLCEAIKFIVAHAEGDVHSKGYQVLYNLDRNTGFDLKEATTQARVATLMAEQLRKCQDMSDEDFEREMRDYISHNGRLEIYAHLHQWRDVQQKMREFLDLQAEHNTERCSMYDLRTAAYKLCKAMGGSPTYSFEGEDYNTLVSDPEELRDLPIKDVRQAIRSGHLMQWLSTFYHEDPTAYFENPQAYNHSLTDFLKMVGSYDGGEIHFKRFSIAQEQFEKKMQDSRMAWDQSFKDKAVFRIAFIAVNVLWLVLLVIFGIDQTPNMVNHVYMYTALVVGIPLGAMLAVRNYFRGNGISLGFLWILGAMLFSLIPAAILSLCLHSYPTITRWAALAMSGTFLLLGLRYAFKKDAAGSLDELKVAFKVDEDESLNEMLHYTFRSRTFKFKGSNFGLMDDAVGEAKSSSTEKVINCVMWSLVPGFLILSMIWFHSSILNHNGPDIDAWRKALSDFWVQFTALF